MKIENHSVRLREDKCRGCMNCIKRCPTEAIRVRNGKAYIIHERCIDCGECIRVCPYHAKRAQRDTLDILAGFKYKIALPAPALYGQFNNLDDIDRVLTAFKMIGFNDIFEVSKGAELISEATRILLKRGELKKPVISSACPAVCRLIRVRFPGLISNVLDLNSPMEEAARLARIKAAEETGLPQEEIGIFFITPCPAKITAIRQPIGLIKSNINGALAIKDIYPKLLEHMNHLEDTKPLRESGVIGVGWASSGGESAALLREHYIAVDGIENVIKVLEEIEDEKLANVDFVELNACTGGCVGGVLCAENPFIARSRLQRLRKYLPVSCNHLEGEEIPEAMSWTSSLKELSVLKLAENVEEALKLMNELNRIAERLPGLDCGTCGAPTCRALAEDIVRGIADESDCIFYGRDDLEKPGLEGPLPPPFRKPAKEDD